MKNVIVIALLLIAVSVVRAQIITFKKLYPQCIATGYSVVERPDGYFVCADGMSDSMAGQTYNTIKLMETDLNGNFLWQKVYGPRVDSCSEIPFNCYASQPASFFSVEDSNFILATYSSEPNCGDNCDPTNPQEAATVYKFDQSGNTLWSKEYFCDFSCYAPTGAISAFYGGFKVDSGYIFVGEEDTAIIGDTPFYSCYYTKTDTSGNQMWSKKISKSEPSGYFGVSALQPMHNGFAISVLTNNYYQQALIATDDTGAILWQKIFGQNIDSGTRYQNYNILVDSNNNVYTYGQSLSNTEVGASITKLDKLGNIIWENDFIDSFTEPEKAIVLSNGDIIIVGNKVTGYGPVGWICKVDVNGNQIWSRAFLNSDTDVVGQKNASLYDIKATTDGGLIATGIQYEFDSFSTYNVWLVKLDTSGCDGSDCGGYVTAGINEISRDQNSFKIFPNPAQIIVTIEWHPNQSNDTHILIYDLLGNEVIDLKTDNSGQAQVDVSGLANGIYMVKLLAPHGDAMSGKLAVIH